MTTPVESPPVKMGRKESETAALAERLAELSIPDLVNALAVTIWKLDNLDTRLRQVSTRLHNLEQEMEDEQ